MTLPSTFDAAAFWAQVNRTDTCWEWTGPIAAGGYGRFCRSIAGRPTNFSAHRTAYELTRGPIPEGHHVHHVCGNRVCVRPSHLRALSTFAHAQEHHRRDPAVEAAEAARLDEWCDANGIRRPWDSPSREVAR